MFTLPALIILLAAFFSSGTAQVLLLHGWLGNGANWNATKRILTTAPYNFPPDVILTPSLPNQVGIVTWAGNIAAYIDTLPVDAHLTIIAHSFSAPATLVLLIAAHHMRADDYAAWTNALISRAPEIEPIATALRTVVFSQWMHAATRIDRLILYHPAVGGGCYACTACHDLPVLCDDAVRDMCTLAAVKGVLFSSVEVAALKIPIVDIYGTHTLCPGPCFGKAGTDGAVSQVDQQLAITAPNYREIKGSGYCHTDFLINLRGAAAELCRLAFPDRHAPQEDNG